MTTLEIIFWSLLTIVFYSYFGYGILLIILVKIREWIRPDLKVTNPGFEPRVSLIVPCYNEASILKEKASNCLELEYPADKLQIIFITDGSNDGSENILQNYSGVEVMHQPQRKGKSAAENRSVAHAKGEIIIFSDANTLLPYDAIRSLVKHYIDPSVGGVSGEKRIIQSGIDNAAGAGEGFYWRYESMLKRYDARLLTIVGAAGELFSFRRHLFTPLEEDTILDDFVLSLRITQAGYRVLYEPDAVALETASSNSREELKRKIRICAGGWQAMMRLKSLLNFTKHPLLTFQYISHRVLRWTLAPLFLILALPLNVILAGHPVYLGFLTVHLLFYILAFIGMWHEKREIKFKIFFIPYYFLLMNYAAIAGFIRFFKGSQSSVWERSERKLIIKESAV